MSKLDGMDSPRTGILTERTLTSAIIQTRLHIPPLRAKLVQRTRLTAYIEQAIESKLLLLSAPAGYGKTTLLSAWANGSSRSVAWFSLDTADNDRTRFLTYLINALQGIQGWIGKSTLDLLTSPQTQSTETLLTPLVNELLSAPHMVLVLDDYHVIEDKHIHDAIIFLLEYLPKNLHLIISTRADPPLPLARLRARHQLRELRTSDLPRIRVFPRNHWRKLANGNFYLTEMVDHIRARVGLHPSDTFVAKLRSLSDELASAPEHDSSVLLIGLNEEGPLTIIEGNHRMAAASLVSPQDIHLRFQFLCGFSPRMTECCWYQTDLSTLWRYARNFVAYLFEDPDLAIEQASQTRLSSDTGAGIGLSS